MVILVVAIPKTIPCKWSHSERLSENSGPAGRYCSTGAIGVPARCDVWSTGLETTSDIPPRAGVLDTRKRLLGFKRRFPDSRRSGRRLGGHFSEPRFRPTSCLPTIHSEQ